MRVSTRSASDVPKLSPAAREFVETELCAYPETLKEIAQRRQEIIEGGSGQAPDEVAVTRRSAGAYSDPTGFRGSLLADDRRLREMGRIVEAIDDTLARLPEEGRELVRLYYWENRGLAEVVDRLAISRPTAYRWLNGVRVAVCARLGWL